MNTKSTIRKSIAIATLALAFPQLAAAIPPGNGTDDPLPPNQAPVAKYTISPNPALVTPQQQVAQARNFGPGGVLAGGINEGDLVKFDGSASTDDTGIVKYEYDLDGNGTYEISGANPKASRRYAATGVYKTKLRVTDEGNKIKVIAHDLLVHARPKPKLTPSRTVALIGQQVDYSAAGSTDDNGIAKYEWDVDGDGTYETNTGTTPTASGSYTTIGDRSVKLRVTDVHGATSGAAVKVVVHRAPTAAFTFDPNPGVTDQEVTFDGSTSGDDGTIAKYEWDLDNDGAFETDTLAVPTAKKSFAAPGTFTVKLRVSDEHGVQDVVSHQVTINPKPVVVTPDPTVTGSDTAAPLVSILSRSLKLGRKGKVSVRIACPATETSCAGRLALRSLRGARSSALGGKAFSLAGGKAMTLKIQLSKANRKAVKRLGRMKARATASATDAAGNKGTTRKVVTIKR